MANAALTLKSGRQYVLFAEQTVTVDNMNESTVPLTAVVKLPYGAVVVGGAVITDVAFDAATATLAVGDSTTTNRYLAAGNIAALGRVPLVPTGYVSDGGEIRITPTFADAVTAGSLRLQVEYVITGRAQEVQPN